EDRSLGTALAQCVNEIDRGRVEPLQILDDKNKRLHAGAGYPPFGHRCQLPALNLIGWKARQAFRRYRDADQRCEQGSILLRVELDLLEDKLERGERSRRRTVGTANPGPSPPQDRMKWRILQELRRPPFDPRVRRIAE